MTHSRRDRLDPIRGGRGNWKDRKLSEDKYCVEAVSKFLKGTIVREDYREDRCEKEECITSRELWRLYEAELASGDCDGPFSKDHLFGSFNAAVDIVYRFNSKERGNHIGNCELDNAGGGWSVHGMMIGTCNAGTHQGPHLKHPCESCNEPDHWEGHLDLQVEARKGKDAVRMVFAEYTFDLDYHDGDRTRATLLGTIEGCIITDCAQS